MGTKKYRSVNKEVLHICHWWSYILGVKSIENAHGQWFIGYFIELYQLYHSRSQDRTGKLPCTTLKKGRLLWCFSSISTFYISSIKCMNSACPPELLPSQWGFSPFRSGSIQMNPIHFTHSLLVSYYLSIAKSLVVAVAIIAYTAITIGACNHYLVHYRSSSGNHCAIHYLLSSAL